MKAKMIDLMKSAIDGTFVAKKHIPQSGTKQVDLQEALVIFERLMASAKGYNNSEVDRLIAKGIDFNHLFMQIPVEKFSQIYTNGLNAYVKDTFLNRLVNVNFGGLEDELNQDTLHHIVINSQIKENSSFDYYMRSMPSSGLPLNRKPIVFKSDTIDYFLDNLDWNGANLPEYMLDQKTKRAVPILASYILHISALSLNKAMTFQEAQTKFLNAAQFDKLILNTNRLDLINSQNQIIYYLGAVMEASGETLELAPLTAIIRKMKFTNKKEKEHLVYNGFRFMKSEHNNSLDFFNLCQSIHGVNWAQEYLNYTKKDLSIMSLENMDRISDNCLKTLIVDNDGAARTDMRAYFKKNKRARHWVDMHDIQLNKEELEAGVEKAANVLGSNAKGKKHKL